MVERPGWNRRRLIEGAFVAIVCAGMAWAAWGFWHDRELPRRFTHIQLGMDRAGVEAVLGAPGWAGGCAGRVRYLPRAECASELGYSSAFFPISPDHYIVQLDRSGRVIEAEPVRSR